MGVLRILGSVLSVIPLGIFFYDLIKGWFVDAHVRFRSVEQWWRWLSPDTLDTGTAFLKQIVPDAQLHSVMNSTAFLAALVPPLVLYVIRRLWFVLAGGKSAGGFTYKSWH